MGLRRPAALLGLLIIVMAAGAWGLPYAAGLRSAVGASPGRAGVPELVDESPAKRAVALAA